jgi:hypothetical protein
MARRETRKMRQIAAWRLCVKSYPGLTKALFSVGLIRYPFFSERPYEARGSEIAI